MNCKRVETLGHMVSRGIFISKNLHQRWASTKLMVEMDPIVDKQLETAEFNPKKHPGILKLKPVQVPEWIQKGMVKAIGDGSIKSLRQGGEKLAAHLNQRHPPPNATEVNIKLSKVKQKFLEKFNTDEMTEEQTAQLLNKNHQNIKMALKQHVYPWQAIEYNATRSLHYMFGRAAQDFAVLYRIFNEIAMTDKDFKPESLFDFGSGIGTVVWAAHKFWKESLKEYYCVDPSNDMHSLAECIIGNEPESPKNVYYRQHLPAAARYTSNIVVSAFSLFELPSAQARLEVILKLWLKTDNYLVIVEQGTNAGFKLVTEARDFILDVSNKPSENDGPRPFHIVAPCPHDLICPRYILDRTPCNFVAPYTTLNLGQNATSELERYSYVVFKKGERPENAEPWPRIVRPTLVRSKHTVCRMCTSDGKLEEIVFTAAKHGKLAYRCARYSNWGDRLPLKIRPGKEDPE